MTSFSISRHLYFFLLVTACSDLFASPDLIFHNGRIVTVDKAFSIVEALAVKNGRILRVGSNEEVLLTKGKSTRVLDLRGKMLLPGLIDSHMHPVSASQSEVNYRIPDLQTIEDVLDYVDNRAQSTPVGKWIWLSGEFFTRLKELRLPTRKEIDRVSPNHPVVVIGFPSSPSAALNSLALKTIGIDKNFAERNPENIEIEPVTGEPTGIVYHPSQYLPKQIPAENLVTMDKQKLLQEMLANYNSVGITTVSDRNALPSDVKLYEALKNSDTLSTRVRILHNVDTWGDRKLQGILADINKIAQHPLREPDAMLQVLGVKVKIDGGILTGTAHMKQPWGEGKFYPNKDMNYRGSQFISGQKLMAMISSSTKAGLQFAGHSVGDAAVQTLLDSYEEVNKHNPIGATRPVITHANFMDEGIINRMSELGVLVDMQPAWLYLDSRMLMTQFGYERLRYFQPLRSLFRQGVIIGGGSDHWSKSDSAGSTNPYNPFLAMWVTIVREPRFSKHAIYPEEALSREQAIRFYTINNAYMLFMEDQVGTLEPGKLADMIIVDQDLLNCDINELKETQVLQTYLNGKLIYSTKRGEALFLN